MGQGHHTLSIRDDETEESWRIVHRFGCGAAGCEGPTGAGMNKTPSCRGIVSPIGDKLSVRAAGILMTGADSAQRLA